MAEGKVVFEVQVTAKGLKQLQGSLGDVDKKTKQVDKSQKAGTKSADGFHKAQKGVARAGMNGTKAFSKMKDGMTGSSGLVGAYATLAANVFAATAAFTALKSAAQISVLIESLETLGAASGQNLGALATRIRDAAGGAIDLSQAMQTASVGASAGFDTSQMIGLTKVAKAAAIALGRDVGDAIDRVTRGAAKLEPEILDELGIFVRVDDAASAYAATIGKTANSLNRFEKRMAFTNEIIDQGTEKFGALMNNDVSSFDKLGATLMDLGRTVTDFFNAVLGPIAGFFANNQIALLGFMAMITKGIMSQALPALQQFGAKALQNAQQALSNAEKEERASNKIITSLQRRVTPLKFLGKGYNDLANATQRGEGSVKSLQISQRKLTDYILGAQKRVNAGQVKNIALVEERIRLAKERLAVEQKLSGEMGKSNARGGSAPVSAASIDVKQSKREASIFKNLEKDSSFKGHMKALKLANRQGKRYRVQNKALAGSNKIFGRSFFGLAKPLNMAKIGMMSFGITSKVAIKGIFTAIPVIGQLLFVLDMLLAGLKSIIGAFAGWRGEASELEKTISQTNSMLDSYSTSQSAAAQATQTAGQRLKTTANATSSLISAVEEQQEAYAKSNAELTFFGKTLQFIGNRFNKIVLRMGGAWNRFGNGFMIVVKQTEIGALKVAKKLSFLVNGIVKLKNLFRSAENQLPLIDMAGFDKDIAKVREEIDGLRTRYRFILDGSSTKLFDKEVLAEAEPALKAFETLLLNGGEASKELKRALSSDFDINTFMTALGEGKSVSGFFGEELLKNTKLLSLLNDPISDNLQLMQLLNIITKAGTATTTAQGKAFIMLEQTLKEAKQTMSEFNKTLTNSSKIGEYATTLDDISVAMEGIIATDGKNGSQQAVQQLFATAEPGYKRLIMFTDAASNASAEYNKQIKEIEDSGKKVTEEDKIRIANETKIGSIIADRAKHVAAEAKEIMKFQLLSKAQISAQNRQTAVLSKFQKLNTAATSARIDSSNKALKISIAGQTLEQTLAKETSGIYNEQGEMKVTEAEMTKDQLQAYSKIKENEEALNKLKGKVIESSERQALIDQAKLALDKKILAESMKQFTLTQRQIKAEEKLGNAGQGMGVAQTPAERLKAEKAIANEKIRVATEEKANLAEKQRIELIIMKARLKADGVSDSDIEAIEKQVKTLHKSEATTAANKLSAVEQEKKLVALSKTKLINTDLQGMKILENADLMNERMKGQKGGAFSKENAAANLANMNDFLSPMRESLRELGPEGELVAMAQEGMLVLGQSFMNTMEVFKKEGATPGEKLVAGAQMAMQAISTISGLMQQSAKAQTAEIDKQIEAEKKRDGSSKGSLAKIDAMEKKKVQIQRKAFEQKKKMDIAQAVISTALGAARSMEMGGIIGPVLAAMTIAMGMAQIAIIKKQTFSGGGSGSPPKPSTIEVGKRDNKVDTSQGATGGETSFLRGNKGMGSNANSFVPGGAAGMKRSYASGGEILVGERGPEIIRPTSSGYNVVPNDKIGGGGSNVNFTINAVDAAGVEQLLVAQRGNIIGMIREAANEHGEEFMENVNTNAYGGESI